MLRVLTLNVWGGVPLVSRHVAARMRAVGEAMGALRPDVVSFQEVWSTEALAILADGLTQHGVTPTWHALGRRAAGGLVVGSRHPWRRAPAFTRFTLGGLPHHVHRGDWYAGKGYLDGVLEAPGGPVRLLATHLQAQYVPGARDVNRFHRTAQIVELAAALHGSEEPALAIGDFNFMEHEDDYRLLTGLARLEDTAVTLDRREPTLLASNAYRRFSRRRDARIDYVFYRPGRARRLAPRTVARTLDGAAGPEVPAYSDHAGVLADLELEDGGTSGLAPSHDTLALATQLLDEGEADARRRRRGMRAGTVAAVGTAALAAHARRQMGRRRFLRTGLTATAFASLGLGGGAGVLAEWFGGSEADGAAAVRGRLAELGAVTAAPDTGGGT